MSYTVTKWLRSCWFWAGPRTREGSETGPDRHRAALPLGPYDPLVYDMWVADSCALWSLFANLYREFLYTPLGFWSKALLSSANDYFPFENELLACYWALVETEHNHRPPRNYTSSAAHLEWWLSDSPFTKLRVLSNTPSSNVSHKNVGYERLGSSRPWRHRLRCLRNWPTCMLLPPFSGTLPSVSQPLIIHPLLGECPAISYLRRKHWGLVAGCVGTTQKQTVVAWWSLSGTSYRIVMKGNPPSGQNHKQCFWFICVGKHSLVYAVFYPYLTS